MTRLVLATAPVALPVFAAPPGGEELLASRRRLPARGTEPPRAGPAQRLAFLVEGGCGSRTGVDGWRRRKRASGGSNGPLGQPSRGWHRRRV